MAEHDDEAHRPSGDPAPQPAEQPATPPPAQGAPLLSETARERELERALASPMPELPENRPRGILGERNPDLRAVDDDFAPDLNSGISQETDLPLVWVGMWLGFLLGFVPGFIVLWVSKHFTLRQKVIWSVVMAVLAAVILVAYATRR